MAHNISGIITSFKYEGNLPNVGLVGDYHLIPLESDYGATSPRKPIAPYEELTPGIREVIKELSLRGKCAYIETAYFGGIGTQISETWQDSEKVDGPLISYDGVENKKEYEHVSIVDASINQALKSMGVIGEEGKDEFDTVGLGRYRTNKKILEAVEKR